MSLKLLQISLHYFLQMNDTKLYVERIALNTSRPVPMIGSVVARSRLFAEVLG